jgi:hypothetical protein
VVGCTTGSRGEVPGERKPVIRYDDDDDDDDGDGNNLNKFLSTVTKLTGCGLNDQGLIPGRGRGSSSFHSVQTVSGFHPASYETRTRGFFTRNKAIAV